MYEEYDWVSWILLNGVLKMSSTTDECIRPVMFETTWQRVAWIILGMDVSILFQFFIVCNII
jgi:hypothetical protein